MTVETITRRDGVEVRRVRREPTEHVGVTLPARCVERLRAIQEREGAALSALVRKCVEVALPLLESSEKVSCRQ